MEARSRIFCLFTAFILVISSEFSEQTESAEYFNGTSFPPPYDLSTSSGETYGDGNSSYPGDSGFTKGLVDDSEEENLQNQASTTQRTTYPSETFSPQTRPPSTTRSTPVPVTPSIPQNLTTPVSPGFSTQSSGDNLGNKGNGQGGGSYAPSNPSPAGPVPGAPIQDGFPGGPGPAADGPGPDGPSTCLCAAICLTTTPGPQAPPGNGPCVSLCACVGASTQSGSPAFPGPAPPSKDRPGGPADAAPQLPVESLPGASAGTDTAQGAVQDGTAVAASQAPPPPPPPSAEG